MNSARVTGPHLTIENDNITYITNCQLGKGSFSNVLNLISHKDRCIKIYKAKDKYTETAYTEKNIIMKLNNLEFIVNLFDYFFYENHYCLILSKYTCNLYDLYIKKNISNRKVKFIAYNILNGLALLKKHKIIHRDLKPENVLIRCCEDTINRCVITDFNSSIDLLEQHIDYSNTNIVSTYYRAPEIFVEELPDYSYPIDMWSFGLILYEIITRHTLFKLKLSSDFKKDNKVLFDLHFNFLGCSNLLLSQYPTQKYNFQINPMLFKSGLQTLFTETIKWDPRSRFTPEDALNYLSDNNFLIQNNSDIREHAL